MTSAIMTTAANLLLRAGIGRSGGFSPDGLLDTVVRFAQLLLQPTFASGFAMYFVAGLVWFRVIGREPLSIAYPILVGITFVLVTAGAIFFFREAITLRKILGLAVILCGILITLTSGSEQFRD